MQADAFASDLSAPPHSAQQSMGPVLVTPGLPAFHEVLICDPGLPCFPLPHPGLEALTSGFMTRIRLDLYVPFRPLAKVLSCPFLTFSSYAHQLLTCVISLILTPDCIMKTETCVYFLQFLLAQKQTPISSPPLGLDSFSSLVLLHSAPCLNHVFAQFTSHSV